MNNDKYFEVYTARLSGALQTLSIVTNGWKDSNARFCKLKNTDIVKSYSSKYLETEDSGNSENRTSSFRINSSFLKKDWIEWLSTEIKSFLISDIPFRESGDRFVSSEDGKDYLTWQVMELIREISRDFESDSITISNVDFHSYSGKLVFIPSDGNFLVLSFMNKVGSS